MVPASSQTASGAASFFSPSDFGVTLSAPLLPPLHTKVCPAGLAAWQQDQSKSCLFPFLRLSINYKKPHQKTNKQTKKADLTQDTARTVKAHRQASLTTQFNIGIKSILSPPTRPPAPSLYPLTLGYAQPPRDPSSRGPACVQACREGKLRANYWHPEPFTRKAWYSWRVFLLSPPCCEGKDAKVFSLLCPGC